MEGFEELKIPFGEIESATNNFGEDNIIGKGGFGYVYRGELRRSDEVTTHTVAIKRLIRQRGQGNREFVKEIQVLSKLRHENIVSLLWYCDEDDEKILVYEFVSRGSLDKYLAPSDLNWIKRLNICLGAARGLEYLHDRNDKKQRIIHRDVKSANVLLDENWMPKISDFGFSKFGNQEYSVTITNCCGTMGYLDPEYFENEALSKESDVYSFGVVLFEVLCGRLCFTPSKFESRTFEHTAKYFVETARRCVKENKLDEIVHDCVKSESNPDSMKVFAEIAYECLNRPREKRPTMTEVVSQLEKALGLQTHPDAELRYDLGKLVFGCEHYRSRCKLHAPCCKQIFPCRQCHDEHTSPEDGHELVLKDVDRVICTICHTEQPVAQICVRCGVKMGEYFCKVCRLYDDETWKGQFHCDGCGVCRLDGRENFFHCGDCGECYPVSGHRTHPYICSKNALRNDYPVCHDS